jgi:hypothetical protein
MKKRKGEAIRATPTPTDADVGVAWLGTLAEPEFRDRVMKELFAQMKKQGAILEAVNCHGRNEHGLDWVVEELGGLSRRLVGIQAKSKPITRQGGSGADSALAVKQQCLSAFDHPVRWHGDEARIDVVELWQSGHITDDAERELSAPQQSRKIQVKKALEVFSLIDKYCPRIVASVPGLAEASYLREKSDPGPLPIRVLGTQLNPQKHFLEPRFSRHSALSPARVFDRQRKQVREEDPIHLEDLLRTPTSTFIVGQELSGKTYLLKRMACLLAAAGCLPVIVDGPQLRAHLPRPLHELLHSHLSWMPKNALADPETTQRTVCLLVDDADALTAGELTSVMSSLHRRIVIIATGRRAPAASGFATFYIAGLRRGTLLRFVRALDLDQADAAALTQRATNYVRRASLVSGLPVNPFTVSVMLGECQIARQSLATPTMGRLLERFVEAQLGSHSDRMRADFETKLQFLTALGGARGRQYSVAQFRQRLSRFMTAHGHAHNPQEFAADLEDSGLLEVDKERDVVGWTHPVFSEFFWIRNLVRERKLEPLCRVLLKRQAQAAAAIAGSLLGNAHELLDALLDELSKASWMQPARRAEGRAAPAEGSLELPDDASEDRLLERIEDEASRPAAKPREALAVGQHELSPSTTSSTDRAFAAFAERYLQEKHYLAENAGAILLNSRALPVEHKIRAVVCVLKSNRRMVRNVFELLGHSLGRRANRLELRIFAEYLALVQAEAMLGDAFLAKVFRDLAAGKGRTEDALTLQDLLVACDGESPVSYVRALKMDGRPEAVASVYFRLVELYFYRFHKPEQKEALRVAMKEVRKLAKGLELPPVPKTA